MSGDYCQKFLHLNNGVALEKPRVFVISFGYKFFVLGIFGHFIVSQVLWGLWNVWRYFDGKYYICWAIAQYSSVHLHCNVQI